jgi:hypothetical protein
MCRSAAVAELSSQGACRAPPSPRRTIDGRPCHVEAASSGQHSDDQHERPPRRSRMVADDSNRLLRKYQLGGNIRTPGVGHAMTCRRQTSRTRICATEPDEVHPKTLNSLLTPAGLRRRQA